VEGTNIAGDDGCSFYVGAGSTGGFTPSTGHNRNYSADCPPTEQPDVLWVWEVPVTGTVPAQDMTNIDILFTSQYTDGTPMPLGTYTATLNVSSNGGSEKVALAMYVVEEYIIPEAGFESDAPVCEDAGMIFTNTTVVGVPWVTDYEWDFGDGITSTEENPVHAYADAGVYTVTLEACNMEGCTEFSQAVEVLPKPVPSFTFTSYSLEVTFTNTSLYGDTFLWDFGDGITSTEENPTHVFATEGPYTVTLWVYNECGVAMYEAVVTLDEVFIYVLPVQYKAVPDEP
jgi:PKD repeat protein